MTAMRRMMVAAALTAAPAAAQHQHHHDQPPAPQVRQAPGAAPNALLDAQLAQLRAATARYRRS